jgi:glycosyltransferase involved in cell wall biosynthesis
MASGPLISVIVPTYNRAGYIVQAVESILQQHPDPGLEVIVVDDGSTDATRDVLAPYEARIRYAYQDNAGLSSARNHGLRLARGALVSFLDSDDWLLRGAIAAQLACMADHREAGAVQCGWRLANESGATLCDVELWHRYPRLDLETWVMATPLLITGMLFHKRWLERVGGFDTELEQVEDVDLVLRLAMLGCEFAWVRHIGVAYRQHSASMTRDALQQVHAAERVLGRLFEHPDLPEHIRQQKDRVFFYRHAWFAWRLHGSGQSDRVEEYLRRSLACAPDGPRQTVLQWARLFVGWWRGVAAESEGLPALLRHVRAVVPLDENDWRSIERVLPWWAAIWSHYAVGERVPPTAWTAGTRLRPPDLIAMAQQSLMITPVASMVDAIDLFLADERGRRDGAPIPADDAATLYLTAFGQTLLARQPRAAVRALGHALRHTRRPRALRAWARFVGNAVGYATSVEDGAVRTWR